MAAASRKRIAIERPARKLGGMRQRLPNWKRLYAPAGKRQPRGCAERGNPQGGRLWPLLLRRWQARCSNFSAHHYSLEALERRATRRARCGREYLPISGRTPVRGRRRYARYGMPASSPIFCMAACPIASVLPFSTKYEVSRHKIVTNF